MTKLVNKTLLGRYFVIEYIDRGSMAEVYKVWDTELAAHLAMKVLHQDLSGDKIFLRRFRREAETLAKLQHPSIVRFFSFRQEGRLAIILIDFIQGDTLKMKIFDRDNPFSKEEILSILNPVIRALHFAHNRGMVHCDIKPANIMIEDSGKTLLSDFGIARMTDAATVTMVGAGTPAYMAPEQIRGEDPLPQTDIYALGIVLFEMLTGGERPFTGERATTTGSTSEKVRWEHINLAPPSPRELNSDISPELEAVVMKCLEKDPKKRYQSALDLLNAIELVLGERVTPAPEVVEPGQKPAPEPDLELKKPKPIKEKKPKTEKEQEPRRKIPAWFWVVGIIVIGAAITGVLSSGGEMATLAIQATETPTLTYTLTPTNTPKPTHTPTLTNTPTLTPTHTATPIGGGGGKIAFVSEREGDFAIYVMNADGSDVTCLTDNPSGDFHPAWSPDGRKIAFESGRDGLYDIYVMNADGSDVTRLTNNPGRDFHYAWSPDGRKIAFVSSRDGNREIYMMNADGSDVTRLTNNPADDWFPVWQP